MELRPYYHGFCLKGEEELFRGLLVDSPFRVAGFSLGAQHLWEALRHWSRHRTPRIEVVQLISPAFFGRKLTPRWVETNLAGFRTRKGEFVRHFLTKGGLPDPKYIDLGCREEQLEEGFKFNWEPIPDLRGVEVRIYLGDRDPIIDWEGALHFFSQIGVVELVRGGDHFLRRGGVPFWEEG